MLIMHIAMQVPVACWTKYYNIYFDITVINLVIFHPWWMTASIEIMILLFLIDILQLINSTTTLKHINYILSWQVWLMFCLFMTIWQPWNMIIFHFRTSSSIVSLLLNLCSIRKQLYTEQCFKLQYCNTPPVSWFAEFN